MHKKRSELPREIPLPRKGTKYVSVASHFQNNKMPLIFILRDILKIARTKHETKKICLGGNIKVNGRVIKDIKFPIGLRDFVEVEEKCYKVILKNKKYFLEEIKKEKKRILKVIGKKILKDKKVQANLEDGTNLLIKEKFSLGDSVILSSPENKLIKILSLKEGANVEIVKGKYLGKIGKVVSIEKVGEKTMFKIKFDDGEALLSKEALLVIE